MNLQFDYSVRPCTKGFKPRTEWRLTTELADGAMFPAECTGGPPYVQRGPTHPPGPGAPAPPTRAAYDPITGIVDGVVDGAGSRSASGTRATSRCSVATPRSAAGGPGGPLREPGPARRPALRRRDGGCGAGGGAVRVLRDPAPASCRTGLVELDAAVDSEQQRYAAVLASAARRPRRSSTSATTTRSPRSTRCRPARPGSSATSTPPRPRA